MRAVLNALGRPGVARAAVDYYRHLPDVWSELGRRSWRLLRARVQVPTLALTGALDGCIDSQLYDVAIARDAFTAGIRVERLADAGHFLHQERPEAVNDLLIDWMARQA